MLWAARAKARSEWDRAHAIAFHISRAMCGKGPTLKQFAPKGLFDDPKPARPMTEEEERIATDLAFKAMSQAWRQYGR